MKTLFKLIVLPLMFSLCLTFSAFAQAPIVGKWKTIDDKTKEAKSIVEIFEKEGKYYGKVIELFIKEGANPKPTCDQCAADDPRKDQPTLGMEVIQGLVPDGDKFSGGTILDPKDGKVYKCKLWREGDTLQVRASILVLYRTQTWLLVP